MDIRKSDSSNVMLCLPLVIVVTLMAKVLSFANSKTATETLISTYQLPPTITTAEAGSAISSLKKVLTGCGDDYLAFRIRYRIGVIYFKAGATEAASEAFLQIINEHKCPELIRICSCNMIGQISRLSGENKEALEAFEQVANLLKQQLHVGSEHTTNLALVKLQCLALFSRAEIYEAERDYTASITEYNRLLHILSHNKSDVILSQYMPLVNDRMSQLYLRQGNVDSYIKLAEASAVNYSEYYRAPIIELEIECLKFLKSVSPNLEFADGSFTTPVQLITYLKDSKDRSSAEQIVSRLGQLCKERSNTYAQILLNYHYAWLLDTLGERDRAVETFMRVSSADIKDANHKVQLKIVAKTLAEYAKIQRAIMLGENADYKPALRVLNTLCVHPNQSHISELAKSVTEAIRTLQREDR